MLAKYDADIIRFALLRNAYSNDIDINDSFFPDAARHIYKMYSTLARVNSADKSKADSAKTETKIAEITAEFEHAMDDNFNTGHMIASSFGWFDFIDAELRKPASNYDLSAIATHIVKLFGVLNILQADACTYISSVKDAFLRTHNITTEFIADRLNARADAKKNRDFARADAVRDELLSMGLQVCDTPHGTEWDIKF
jgi:cysteinyl-tRNA synthetase